MATVEPPSLEPVAPAPSAPPSRLKRRLLVAGGVVAALLLVVGLVHRPVLRAMVRSEAKKFGLEIEFEDFGVRWSGVTLHKARIGLEGVAGFRAEAGAVEVDFAGFSVSRIEARPLELT